MPCFWCALVNHCIVLCTCFWFALVDSCLGCAIVVTQRSGPLPRYDAAALVQKRQWMVRSTASFVKAVLRPVTSAGLTILGIFWYQCCEYQCWLNAHEKKAFMLLLVDETWILLRSCAVGFCVCPAGLDCASVLHIVSWDALFLVCTC